MLLLLELKVYTIEELNQKHFAAYKTMLSQFATSYGKGKRDKVRSLDELRAIGKSKPPEERGVEGRTNNKHISRLSSLVGFMRVEGLMSVDINFKHLRIKSTTRGRDLTQAARPKRVDTLFNLPCISGCASAEKPFEEGPEIYHCANYFGPQLLYYLGGRREEIFGLRIAEVVPNATVPYLMIVPNAYRGLKTLASPRVLPIPPELVRLNFLQYWQAIRNLGHDLLFPELRWGDSKMPLGDRFYKNFKPGLELIRADFPEEERGDTPIIPDQEPDKVDKQAFMFRQMRKAFGAALKKKGVSTEERSDLLGHAGQTVNEETYADSTELKRKLELINLIPNVTKHLSPRPIQLLPWVRDDLPPLNARGRERKRRRR